MVLSEDQEFPGKAETKGTGVQLKPGRVGPSITLAKGGRSIAIVAPSGAVTRRVKGVKKPVPHSLLPKHLSSLTRSMRLEFRKVGHPRVSFRRAPGEPSAPYRLARYSFAGSDSQRWDALSWGLFGVDTQSMLAIRGGYGAMRLLDRLRRQVQFLKSHHAPIGVKRIAGFSDFTAILLAAHTLLGWASIHGPMLSASGGPRSRRLLARAMTTSPSQLYKNQKVSSLRSTGSPGSGTIRGVLLGGNLSIVDALYGSDILPSLNGAILFVEEVKEPGRKIDRMIQSLKIRGAANQVRAVVVGRTSHLPPNIVASLLQDSWGVPVVFGLPAGHGSGTNLPVWIGLEHELQFGSAKTAALYIRP